MRTLKEPLCVFSRLSRPGPGAEVCSFPVTSPSCRAALSRFSGENRPWSRNGSWPHPRLRPRGKGPLIPTPASRWHACEAADSAGVAGIQSRWSASQEHGSVRSHASCGECVLKAGLMGSQADGEEGDVGRGVLSPSPPPWPGREAC